jgi:hypothetical protein
VSERSRIPITGGESIAGPPLLDVSRNYCEHHSPLGFPCGEPGELCSICSGPMQLTSEQVAMVRTIRNQVSRARQAGLPLLQMVGHDIVRLA